MYAACKEQGTGDDLPQKFEAQLCFFSDAVWNREKCKVLTSAQCIGPISQISNPLLEKTEIPSPLPVHY